MPISEILLLDCRRIYFTRVSTRKPLLSKKAIHLINDQVAAGDDTLLHLNSWIGFYAIIHNLLGAV